MNKIIKNILFIVLLSISSSGLANSVLRFEPVSFDKYTSNLKIYPEKRTHMQQPSKINNALNFLGKKVKAGLKFGFNNYDKILSKKFAAAAIIVGAPYLYFSDTALELITRNITDFTLKMSGAVTDSILMGIIKNPMAISKIIALMSAQQTGQKIAEKAGIKLAEILLTAVTLGRYTA